MTREGQFGPMSIDTRSDRERRVVALLWAAARAIPSPENARDWLHEPQDALGGLAPSAAAWLSSADMRQAEELLAQDFPVSCPTPRNSGVGNRLPFVTRE